MKNDRLPEKFFKENPLKPVSTATIGHFMVTTFLNGELEKKISNWTSQKIDDERRQAIEQERTLIEHTDDPAALVEIVRKGSDSFNRMLLCQKIVACQEEAMPLLLKRYRTCALDSFIDTSMVLFAMTDGRYTQELLNLYGQIRCPYAKACACLLFGIRNMADTLPLLLAEYERLKREYPEKSYNQHPLLAIYLLCGRA